MLAFTLLLALAATFVLLSAVLLYFPCRARRALAKMEARDAVIYLFGQQLKLLTLQGVILQNGEDMAAFSARVDKAYGFPTPGFSGVVQAFQLARFSTHEITGEHKQQMMASRKLLLIASKRKLSFIRYLFFRYIWGV
jgi:hypothetical protein